MRPPVSCGPRELRGHLEVSQALEESKEVVESRSVDRKGLMVGQGWCQSISWRPVRTQISVAVVSMGDAEGRKADIPSLSSRPNTSPSKRTCHPGDGGGGEGILKQLRLNLKWPRTKPGNDSFDLITISTSGQNASLRSTLGKRSVNFLQSAFVVWKIGLYLSIRMYAGWWDLVSPAASAIWQLSLNLLACPFPHQWKEVHCSARVSRFIVGTKGDRSLSSVCFKLISIILLYNTEISPHPISFFFLVSMTSECWEVPALNHINSISWNHLWYLPFLYANVSRSFKFFFTVTTIHSSWSLMCIPHLSILTSHPCQSLFLKSLALQSDSSCVL